MANIQIEILNVTAKTNPTKQPGKTYQSLEVAYKNLSFGGKVEGRKIMSFGATATTFKALATASAGEVYDVEVVKNTDSGYNDWVAAKKSNGAPASASVSSGPQSNTSGNASPRSTYETPEERAKKQIYIVRQSSLSTAVEALSVGAKAPPKPDDIVQLAKVFEDYVFGTTQKPVEEEPDAFAGLESEVL